MDIKSIIAKSNVTKGNNTPVGAAGDANDGDSQSPRVAAMKRRMKGKLQKKEEK